MSHLEMSLDTMMKEEKGEPRRTPVITKEEKVVNSETPPNKEEDQDTTILKTIQDPLYLNRKKLVTKLPKIEVALETEAAEAEATELLATRYVQNNLIKS